MFADELADLKDRYPDRLQLLHVLSREPQCSALLSGRLDADAARRAHRGAGRRGPVDEWFLCGPYGMVRARARSPSGACRRRPSTSNCSTSTQPRRRRASRRTSPAREVSVTIMLDGRVSSFTMGRDERVLDAALRVRGRAALRLQGRGLLDLPGQGASRAR